MNKLTHEDFGIAGQVYPEDMAEIAASGFKSVVCNRPDGEEEGQPTMAENRVAAEAVGLVYAELPVRGMPTAEEAAAFAEMVKGLPKPILAHCRSGGRTKALVGMVVG